MHPFYTDKGESKDKKQVERPARDYDKLWQLTQQAYNNNVAREAKRMGITEEEYLRIKYSLSYGELEQQ